MRNKNWHSLKLKVYPSLHEESEKGWVWIPSFEPINSEFIRIKNPRTGDWIVCERRTIDDNYIKQYNERPHTKRISNKNKCIVINEFYRNKLGISKYEEAEFYITNAEGCIDKYFRAPRNHPNSYIRTSITIAVISVVISAISLILGVCSVILSLK